MSTMKRRCLILLSGLLSVYHPVFANTESDNVEDFFSLSPAELAAIEVTIASGTPKPVFQSAAITSVITAEQIKAMGAIQLHEVLETVPSIHARVQELTGDYQYTVRGIQNGTNSEFLILMNGTRITTAFRGTLMIGTEFSLDAIQRIEVIRGPGSALYGADAFAGVINIVTKKAHDINDTEVGVRAGEYDNRSGWAQHGGHWGSWDVAASLQYQQSDDDKSRVIHKDSQSALDQFFGSQASYAPGVMDMAYSNYNGHLELQRKHWNLGFWAMSMTGGLRAGAAGALDPKTIVDGVEYGVAFGENYVADMRFSTEDWFQDWELLGHLSYLHYDLTTRFQPFPENTVLPINQDANIDLLTPRGFAMYPAGVISDSRQIENIPAVEASAIYRGLPHHQLLLSAGFRHENLMVSQLTNYGPGVINPESLLPPPQINIITDPLTNVTDTPYSFLPDMQRSIWSYVMQDEWQINHAWQLTTGVRYDHYSDFGDTVNPRAALVWDINKQMTSKLLYGRAFRAPNFSERGNRNNDVQLGNPNLQPEIINTYEWALDYRPTAKLRMATNLYFYQIHDLITLVPDAGKTSSTFQNHGDHDGFGNEFEWRWQANEQWSLSGNYAWQHSLNSTTDQPTTGVPEHHLFFAVDWHFLPHWQLRPQFNWIAGRVSPVGDLRDLPDYGTVDLTVRGNKLYQQLSVTASLRNLFDSQGREQAISTLPENIPMPGRTFYFEAALHF